MASPPVVGAWKLRSFDLVLASNPETVVGQPIGSSPLGTIVFTSEGYMSCLLTSSEAASSIASSSWVSATDEEIVRTARAMTTYCGYYKLLDSEQDALLSTKVDVALDPNWIGGQQVRKWEVSQEAGKTLLTLRPVQHFTLPTGLEVAGILIWEKLPPAHEVQSNL